METADLGRKLAKKIRSGGVICLYGRLGAGKTTLTQFIARHLGIKQKVISPTFIIARRYNFKNNFFYHVDLYRLKDLNDAQAIGIEEMWGNPRNIVVIEWPEIIESILPKNAVKIHISENHEIIS